MTHRALSVSAIRLYDRCPLAFRFRYVDRVPEVPTVPMRVGLGVHRVIARVLGAEWEGRAEPDAAARSARLAKFLDDERTLPPEVFASVEAMVRKWASEETFDFRGVTALRLECRLSLSGPNFESETAEADRFVGVVDRLELLGDGSARIVDYKATYRVRPLSEVEEDFQLRAYGWLVRRGLEFDGPVTIAFAYPALGSATRSVDLGLDTFDDVRRTVEAKEKQIRGDSAWSPKVGEACAGCSYRDRCPAFAAALAENRLPLVTPETVAGIARAWRARKKYDEEVEAALKVYATDRPILDPATGKTIAEYAGRPETSIPDAERAANLLRDLGASQADVWKALRISKTAFEGAARAAGLTKKRIEEELAKVAEVDVGTVFTWREKA